jgi:hypothetical protein
MTAANVKSAGFLCISIVWTMMVFAFVAKFVLLAPEIVLRAPKVNEADVSVHNSPNCSRP